MIRSGSTVQSALWRGGPARGITRSQRATISASWLDRSTGTPRARTRSRMRAARAARILERVRALGVPVLLSSHEAEIVALCDRVIPLAGPPLHRAD